MSICMVYLFEPLFQFFWDIYPASHFCASVLFLHDVHSAWDSLPPTHHHHGHHPSHASRTGFNVCSLDHFPGNSQQKAGSFLRVPLTLGSCGVGMDYREKGRGTESSVHHVEVLTAAFTAKTRPPARCQQDCVSYQVLLVSL